MHEETAIKTALKTYQQIGAQMGADTPGTSEMLTSQIYLFATWATLNDCPDLKAALARLDEHRAFLEGWGFPPEMAATAIARLRERARALGWRLEAI